MGTILKMINKIRHLAVFFIQQKRGEENGPEFNQRTLISHPCKVDEENDG